MLIIGAARCRLHDKRNRADRPAGIFTAEAGSITRTMFRLNQSSSCPSGFLSNGGRATWAVSEQATGPAFPSFCRQQRSRPQTRLQICARLANFRRTALTSCSCRLVLLIDTSPSLNPAQTACEDTTLSCPVRGSSDRKLVELYRGGMAPPTPPGSLSVGATGSAPDRLQCPRLCLLASA